MNKYSVVLCIAFAFAACHLSEVATTPLPSPRTYEDGDGDSESQKDLQLKKILLPKNKIRTKRGIPCSRVEDTDCEWEINPPCTCDPCDVVRHANEARMLRKQHRKIVTEMKINRLKRKLHTAVCPSCALAHERELEQKPCNKPHVGITVVVPNGNQHGGSEVPVPTVEYPSLPPPRQTYAQAQVVQTGSQVFTSDPLYDEPIVPPYEPMVPRPQYGAMVPEAQFEPMVPEPQRFEGFGAAAPWMRSAGEAADRKKPTEEVFEQDTQRSIQKSEGLLTIFVENQNTTTTEAPNDSEEAWPFKNATYYAAGTQPPSLKDITIEVPPYDSGEAIQVPFNHNGPPKTYDSGEIGPINYTWSPREYDTNEAIPINYTEPPYNHDSEAVPVNYTWSPREYDTNEAIPINYTEPPYNHDSEAVPVNYNGPQKAETSLRAPPTDEVLWQNAYLAASKAVASALNKSFSTDTLKSSDSSAVKRNCTGSQCMTVCLETGCLKHEVRQKRDTSYRMPFASALLTGLVSAVIGL